MNKTRKSIIENNEISEIVTLELSGYPQKVLIEGKKKDLPIVIFLHGGPGTPIPFSVGCRGMFPEITEKYLMVYWDQLGCGINNCVIDERFTIDKFVAMTKDLVEEIKRRFPNQKIHIFATSWGSILSAKVLEKSKEMIDGVVVYGQITKKVFFNEEVFQELKNSDLSVKKLDRMKKINIEEITSKDLQMVSTAIRKYTNGYQNKNGDAMPLKGILYGLLTSPDYRLRDFRAMVLNGYLNNVYLWKEILKLDLTDTLKNVQIPYKIIQGDTDIVASTKEVRKMVEESKNSFLQYKIVSNAGHLPNKAVMDTVLEELDLQIYG